MKIKDNIYNIIYALLPSIVLTGISLYLGSMLFQDKAAVYFFILWGLMAPGIVIICFPLNLYLFERLKHHKEKSSKSIILLLYGSIVPVITNVLFTILCKIILISL